MLSAGREKVKFERFRKFIAFIIVIRYNKQVNLFKETVQVLFLGGPEI